jgi:hypothetical protein
MPQAQVLHLTLRPRRAVEPRMTRSAQQAARVVMVPGIPRRVGTRLRLGDPGAMHLVLRQATRQASLQMMRSVMLRAPKVRKEPQGRVMLQARRAHLILRLQRVTARPMVLCRQWVLLVTAGLQMRPLRKMGAQYQLVRPVPPTHQTLATQQAG